MLEKNDNNFIRINTINYTFSNVIVVIRRRIKNEQDFAYTRRYKIQFTRGSPVKSAILFS